MTTNIYGIGFLLKEGNVDVEDTMLKKDLQKSTLLKIRLRETDLSAVNPRIKVTKNILVYKYA